MSALTLASSAFARGPIYLKDPSGSAVAAGSSTPYSPKMTCSGATADAVQFFGSPPVIGNAGCHASIINGYGLSQNDGECKVFDAGAPAWITVSAATQDACNTAGGMWFPVLGALYESDPASASKDHGAGSPAYAVPFARHGISAGYHFQQGRDAQSGEAPRNYFRLPGFASSHGMFGGFKDIFGRQLASPSDSSPALFDMSAYDFATSQCAWCHPGGGNMEYDREGFRYDGVGGLFQSGPNPSPKEGDYYSFDPNTGTLVSKAPDWQAGGAGEIDCLICHTETAYGYSHLARSHALSERKAPGYAASFGLAGPDGASGYLSIPALGGNGVNPDVSSMTWNEQNWFFSWLTYTSVSGVYIEDARPIPPKEACAQCHFADASVTGNGPAGQPLGYSSFQKILLAGTVDDADMVLPGGKNSVDWRIFHGRAGSDKRGMSINDANNPDAHIDAGTNCSTCHYLLGAAGNYQDPCLVCHTEFYGAPFTDPVTPATPEIFPAVTDGSGNLIQPAREVFKIDHQFARGNSKPEGAGTDQFDNTVTCQSCHINRTHPNTGSAPDPASAHAAFPALHFDRIDCKTCHIPLVNGPMKLDTVDFTAGYYQQGAREQRSAAPSGIGFKPLYVWRTKTHDGSGMHIVPVSVVSVAWWGDALSWNLDGSAAAQRPVLQRTAQVAAEALRAAYGDSDGNGTYDWPLNRAQGGDVALIVNTAPEVTDMVARLRTGGVAEPVMNLSFEQQTVNHNVAPKSSGRILGSPAGGGCVMCHSSSDPNSPDYSIKSVGFFDKTFTLFGQPTDGGAGIVQTAVNIAGSATAAERIKAVFDTKSDTGSAVVIDLSGSPGSTIRNTLNQDELLGRAAYADPTVAGVPSPTAMFSYVLNGLSVAFDASASYCPSGNCSYSWNFGDLSAGSGVAPSHTYGAAGTFSVRATVLDNVNFTQHTKSSPISVVAADLPPLASSVFSFGADTWTATLVDASVDDDGVRLVTVNWGDGTMLATGSAGDTFTHTYLNVGPFTITHKAIDTLGQQDSEALTVSPAYFTIAGTVVKSATATWAGGQCTIQCSTQTVCARTAGANPPGCGANWNASAGRCEKPIGTAYASHTFASTQQACTAVVSASVQVKKGTSVVRTVYTAANGTFSAGSLKPGTYTLTVTKAGYSFTAPAATIALGPSSLGNGIAATAP
ncbi:MAG: PKD domain-containing protein [Deltaproteobacteria bacterium]|nr:PKD domain-containing protein [Deltaproteobacteria bacterium]